MVFFCVGRDKKKHKKHKRGVELPSAPVGEGGGVEAAGRGVGVVVRRGSLEKEAKALKKGVMLCFCICVCVVLFLCFCFCVFDCGVLGFGLFVVGVFVFGVFVVCFVCCVFLLLSVCFAFSVVCFCFVVILLVGYWYRCAVYLFRRSFAAQRCCSEN